MQGWKPPTGKREIDVYQPNMEGKSANPIASNSLPHKNESDSQMQYRLSKAVINN